MVEVVAALIREGDRFLICQRPQNKARALLWEFPGGKVEAGETKQQALVRECQEELDVILTVGKLYFEVVHSYPDIIIRLSLFESMIKMGKPINKEHAAVAWIKRNQLQLYTFCPADMDIIVKLSNDG